MKEVVPFVPADVSLVDECGFVGRMPEWPETLQEGRLRMAARVEEYISRSYRLGGMSFVLVTHGDCVASCTVLAKSCAKFGAGCYRVHDVDYCAYVSISRSCDEITEPRMSDKSAGWTVVQKGVKLLGMGVAAPAECAEADEMVIAEEARQLDSRYGQKLASKKVNSDMEEQDPLQKRSTTVVLRQRYQELVRLQDQIGCNIDDMLPGSPAAADER